MRRKKKYTGLIGEEKQRKKSGSIILLEFKSASLGAEKAKLASHRAVLSCSSKWFKDSKAAEVDSFAPLSGTMIIRRGGVTVRRSELHFGK